MGAVFRPKDLANRHKKIISNDAVKDFIPDAKDSDTDIQKEIIIRRERKAREKVLESTDFDNYLESMNQKEASYRVTNNTNKSNTDDKDNKN